MESQDLEKGCAFVLMGHGWKHSFCLFEGSQEHSSSSHQVTVQKLLGERRRGLQGSDHDCWESHPWEKQQMSGRGRGVKGHSPSCPDGEVLTQEPEEVRWPMLPQAGVSPVLSCLSQSVIPHLNTQKGTRYQHAQSLHNWQGKKKINTTSFSAERCEIRIGTLWTVTGAAMATCTSHPSDQLHNREKLSSQVSHVVWVVHWICPFCDGLRLKSCTDTWLCLKADAALWWLHYRCFLRRRDTLPPPNALYH